MRKRLERLPGRVLAGLPASFRDRLTGLALRAMMASAARAVTHPLRFALNELFLRHRVGVYHLRGSGRTLFIRHPASDAWVVHEVINRGVYSPPPEVMRAIRRNGRPPRIVDLGAHVGSATLLLLDRFPDAHVLAVEPNPETATLLRRMIERNGLGRQCELRQVAAGTEPGTAMITGFSLLSHLVREDTQEAVDQFPFLRALQKQEGAPTQVEVIDVLPLLGGADLVKLDIEGAEWRILQDPRFAGLGIGAIVLEYHPQGAPEADTTQAIRRVLGDAGFIVGEPFDEHNGVGLLWAWRD